MPTRLRAVRHTFLTNKAVGDTSQVPVVGCSVGFYKRGATVSGTYSVGGPNITVGVRDSGGLKVGDTVQEGASAAATATVDTITSRTSIILDQASGTLSLVDGDRLVVTTDRPVVYSESSGASTASGSPTLTSDANGAVVGYVKEPVDLIAGLTAGGTPSISATLVTDAGGNYDEPKPWIDVRDYANNIAFAYAALPTAGGTIFVPGGTYTLTAGLVFTSSKSVNLIGDDDGSTIITGGANPGFHLLEIQGANTKLRNIQLDGGATAVGNFDCLRIINTGAAPRNNIFENLYIVNARRNNLRIEGAFDQKFRDCEFNYAWDYSTYIDDVGANDATHIDFDNCEWGGNSLSTQASTAPLDRAAVRVEHGFAVGFTNCRFEGNRGGAGVLSANGVSASTCPAIAFYKCHFAIDGTGSIYNPTTRPAQFIMLEACRGWSVIGCTFEGSTTGSVNPTYAIRGYNSDHGVWMGGVISDIDTNFSLFDSDSKHLFIVEPEFGGTATEHHADTLVNAVRAGGGLKLQVFATDSDRSTYARAVAGTLIYVTTPTAPTSHLQVYTGSAWKGIAEQGTAI